MGTKIKLFIVFFVIVSIGNINAPIWIILLLSNRIYNYPSRIGGVNVNKDELMLLVGNNIRRYRLEHHLTQDQLAEKAGISTSFCANLERGKKSMSIMTLRDIADSLEISVDYLLYEENTKIHIRNIEILLNNKTESFIISIEKLIRVCISEFFDTDAESR